MCTRVHGVSLLTNVMETHVKPMSNQCLPHLSALDYICLPMVSSADEWGVHPCKCMYIHVKLSRLVSIGLFGACRGVRVPAFVVIIKDNMIVNNKIFIDSRVIHSMLPRAPHPHVLVSTFGIRTDPHMCLLILCPLIHDYHHNNSGLRQHQAARSRAKTVRNEWDEVRTNLALHSYPNPSSDPHFRVHGHA